MFRHLRLTEQDSQSYLDGTDVSYEELMTLDGTIAREDLIRIYRNALAISGLPDLGLSVGTQLNLSTHGPLGVAIFSGPDLRQALTLLAKYSQIRINLFSFALDEARAGMTVRFSESCDLGDLQVFITESAFSSIFSAINHFAGVGKFSGKISFAYPKPGYGQKYYDHFGGDITFNQEATELFLPESMLSTPSPVADPELCRQSVAICERQLAEMNSDEPGESVTSTEQAVSQLIVDNPGSIWSLKDVASRLHVSPRTLIRRLDSEGTKFQTVRDEAAKQQVANYLSDENLSVESVGHLMGFSDVSSFRRSFKRWFGETPSQYIARARGVGSRQQTD